MSRSKLTEAGGGESSAGVLPPYDTIAAVHDSIHTIVHESLINPARGVRGIVTIGIDSPTQLLNITDDVSYLDWVFSVHVGGLTTASSVAHFHELSHRM